MSVVLIIVLTFGVLDAASLWTMLKAAKLADEMANRV